MVTRSSGSRRNSSFSSKMRGRSCSMIIRGLQKLSLIDYSPYTCSVVFLVGCNFRCGFCHNPELVVGSSSSSEISKKEVIDFLEKRKKWLDGVCITGGEPTLNSDLPDFIRDVKKLNYQVKLDSNGTNPTMLKLLLENKLIDYLAMDIKSSLEEYKNVANVEANGIKLCEDNPIVIPTMFCSAIKD